MPPSGSPIGNSVEGIDDTISAKISALAEIGVRLRLLHVHDAFSLLKNAFTLPKMLYTLRTAPCFYLSSSRASMIYRDHCWQTLPTSPLMTIIQPGPKLFFQ